MSVTDTPDAPEVVEPFHFITSLDPSGELEAAMPIMWCVQPSTREELVNRAIAQPWLLISVIHVSGEGRGASYTETNRYLVPLTSRMEYVRFSRPGRNIVKGTIVWASGDATASNLKHMFNAKRNGAYEMDVVDYEGDFHYSFTMYREKKKDLHAARYGHTTSYEVQVPATLFGKPSPEFEKLYFGKFFSTRLVDECHRRKRRVLWLAFPIFLVWTTTIKALFFVGAQLIGYRKARLRPVFHPLKSDIDGVLHDVLPKRDPLRWFKTVDNKWRPFPVAVFNPLSILAVWGVIAFLANLTQGDKHSKDYGQHYLFSLRWYESLEWSVIVHVAVVAIFLVGGLLFLLAGGARNIVSPPDKVEERKAAKVARKARKRAAAADADLRKRSIMVRELDGELAQMSCEVLPSKVGLGALPARKRSVHLFLQEGKRRVCKPFAS